MSPNIGRPLFDCSFVAYGLETVLRLMRGKAPDRWLLPDYKLYFRNEIYDDLAVRSQRRFQVSTPASHLRIAPDQDLTN